MSERELELGGAPPPPGPDEPHGLAARAVYPFRSPPPPEPAQEMGFFTDTSVCIGCKACEVACKEWNLPPAGGPRAWRDGYDNTGGLTATEWRHVKFVERPAGDLPPPAVLPDGTFDLDALFAEPKQGAWHMLSDSCKHCDDAPCHSACPTGAIVRTPFASIFLQPDICTGCGACVTSCPFGVVAESEADGHAHKCTMCHDRVADGLVPACAKACPTQSIQFGPLEELRERADARLATVHDRGHEGARLYGAEATEGYSALHSFYLLMDEPEAYGLPDAPVNPWIHLGGDYLRGLAALVAMLVLVAVAVTAL